MINKTIEQIEETIRKMEHVDSGKKDELRRLLAELKTEIDALSATHGDQARQIESHLGALSPQDLTASVRGFEVSHPKLVGAINEFCKLLAGIGI